MWHVHVHVHVHLHVHACHLQVTTSANLCFAIYDFALDSSGLEEAMTDFWENNTVVEA